MMIKLDRETTSDLGPDELFLERSLYPLKSHPWDRRKNRAHDSNGGLTPPGN
jgi:hypothetical protein